MPRYAMVTDLRKCVACEACTSACNGEWEIPPGQARTRVRKTPVSGTFPMLMASALVAQCNHCDHPTCIAACPSGATRQDEQGVVVVDQDLCIGCGFCVEACPYDARFIHALAKKADKCDFCAPRREQGLLPACVTTCPAQAKYFGDLEDRDSEVFRMVFTEGARRMESRSMAMGPNVYYLGRTDHLDLIEATFPPREPRMPTAGKVWERIAKPAVVGIVGLAFLGQAVAFFHQLWNGEKEHED